MNFNVNTERYVKAFVIAMPRKSRVVNRLLLKKMKMDAKFNGSDDQCEKLLLLLGDDKLFQSIVSTKKQTLRYYMWMMLKSTDRMENNSKAIKKYLNMMNVIGQTYDDMRMKQFEIYVRDLLGNHKSFSHTAASIDAIYEKQVAALKNGKYDEYLKLVQIEKAQFDSILGFTKKAAKAKSKYFAFVQAMFIILKLDYDGTVKSATFWYFLLMFVVGTVIGSVVAFGVGNTSVTVWFGAAVGGLIIGYRFVMLLISVVVDFAMHIIGNLYQLIKE